MYNPKSKAPLIVVICARTQACDGLVEMIRSVAPKLRVGKVALCDLHRAVKNLLTRNTPLAAVIHFDPKPTGHVDLVPSGVAHTLMSTARSELRTLDNFNPGFILYTAADEQTVKTMTRPIPALSGIRSNNIHTLHPDKLERIKAILSIYAPNVIGSTKVRPRYSRRISHNKLRGARARFAARFSQIG